MDGFVPTPLIHRAKFTSVIVVVGTIISFIPLLLLASSNDLDLPPPPIQSSTHVGDDYLSSNTPIVYAPFCRESMIASLAIGIPFFLDLLLDLVATRSFKEYLDGGKKTSGAVRLNLQERSMFVVGVLMCGLTTIASIDTQYDIISALFTVSTNVTTFLCTAPLFVFLERISTSDWAPLQTLIAVVCVTVVGILGSWQPVLPSNAPSFQTITLVCLILIVVVMAIFVNIVTHKAMKSMRRIWIETAEKHENSNGTMDDDSTIVVRTRYERMKEGWKLLRHQFELNYAVICVSFALLVVITSNIWFYVDIFKGSFSNYRFGFYNYVKMMANAVVLVVEMRVRNSEVKSGLDVIESRRAFVRFVSHEVRTPLSTAIMGLQLLLEEARDEQVTAAAVAATLSVAAVNAAASLNTRIQEQRDMLRYY